MALLALVISLAPLLLWVYFHATTVRELSARLTALQAHGQPLTLPEAAPKPVPDDQNAATLYQQVFQVDFSRETRPREPFAGLTETERDFLMTYLRQATPESDARVAALLARPETARALTILEAGSRRPACVFPVHWQDGIDIREPHLGRFRAAATLLAARAVLESRRGQPEDAMRWLTVGVRMSAHAGAEPTFMPSLTQYSMLSILARAAEKAVNQLAVAAPYAAELDRTLARQDLSAGFLNALRGERAMDLGVFTDIQTTGGRRLFGSAGEDKALTEFGRILARPPFLTMLLYDELTSLRRWDYLMAAAGQSWPQMVAERGGSGRPERWHWFTPMTGILLPVTERAVERRDQAQAMIGLWRTALALKGYQGTHGQYPATLADLQKTLDWTIPPDRFSGKPLIYRPERTGFLLYSVGPDLKDNGAQSQYDAQGKYHEEGDIVWRCGK